jgi:hypothetical protein
MEKKKMSKYKLVNKREKKYDKKEQTDLILFLKQGFRKDKKKLKNSN